MKREYFFPILLTIILTAVAMELFIFSRNEASEEQAEAMLPLEMRIYSGGYLSGSTAVELKDGKVRISETGPAGENAREETVVPAREAWDAFFAACDALDIWSWKESYIDPDIMDGHQWSVLLVYPDRELRSSGSNSYPPGGQSIAKGRTPEFAAFLKALETLTGEPVN